LLRDYVPKTIRVRFLALLPTKGTVGLKNPMGGLIEHDRSKVIPFGGGGLLYINRRCFQSQNEYESFRTSLINELEEIADPKTGTKLAQKVYKAEELYSGPYLSLAPDIVVAPNEGYMLGNVGEVEDIWIYPESDWTRCHRLQGIFTVLGPGIKQGLQIQGARIYDLAPTILHLFGIPVPQGTDGRVLQETFEKGSALATRELTYQGTGERSRVSDKIKGLKATDRI